MDDVDYDQCENNFITELWVALLGLYITQVQLGNNSRRTVSISVAIIIIMYIHIGVRNSRPPHHR